MWLFKKLLEQNVTQSVAFVWLHLQDPEIKENKRESKPMHEEGEGISRGFCPSNKGK